MDDEWIFMAPYLTLMTVIQNRPQVAQLATQVQDVTGDVVEVAFVDQGYTGDRPAQEAAAYSIQLDVVKLPDTL
jgi:hypothetical protein